MRITSPQSVAAHPVWRYLAWLWLVCALLLSSGLLTEASGDPPTNEARVSVAMTLVDAGLDCTDQCPEDLPANGCPAGCQSCVCCSSPVAYLLPTLSSTPPITPDSDDGSFPVTRLAPERLDRGIFRPPRPSSA